MTEENLTRPEMFVERSHARRSIVSKRMESLKKNKGLCALCVHRDSTFGVLHCKRDMDRHHGICDQDGQKPKFTVDPIVVEGLRDDT